MDDFLKIKEKLLNELTVCVTVLNDINDTNLNRDLGKIILISKYQGKIEILNELYQITIGLLDGICGNDNLNIGKRLALKTRLNTYST